MTNPTPRPELVQRNPDGTFTKETLKRAMKALKKRLKLARLDDESRLGRNPLTKGGHSGVFAVKPPDQYPPEVWESLVAAGRVERVGPELLAPVASEPDE